MRAIGYFRETKRQSLAEQSESFLEFCRANGYEAAATFFDGRAEGLATGMEELLMHAGLLDDHPRSKELIWILLAQRGARALAAMHLHANEMTLEEAAQFASERVPRGWLPADGSTITHEVHFYLQQPVYGTSYVIGKIMLDNLMAERARQQGDDFTLKGFIDDLNRIGIIPVSMIRWELVVN